MVSRKAVQEEWCVALQDPETGEVIGTIKFKGIEVQMHASKREKPKCHG